MKTLDEKHLYEDTILQVKRLSDALLSKDMEQINRAVAAIASELKPISIHAFLDAAKASLSLSDAEQLIQHQIEDEYEEVKDECGELAEAIGLEILFFNGECSDVIADVDWYVGAIDPRNGLEEILQEVSHVRWFKGDGYYYKREVDKSWTGPFSSETVAEVVALATHIPLESELISKHSARGNQ
jgi:hypothetical protein